MFPFKLVLTAATLLATAACTLPPAQQATARLSAQTPATVQVAGPASTSKGTPPYAQLIPSESSMGIVQSRNSLPPGAE